MCESGSALSNAVDFAKAPLLTLWHLQAQFLVALQSLGYVENLSHPLPLLGLQGAKLIPVPAQFLTQQIFKMPKSSRSGFTWGCWGLNSCEETGSYRGKALAEALL